VRRVADQTTDLRRGVPELMPVLRRPAPTLRQISQRLPFFHPRWNEAYGWRAAGALATLSASTFAFAYLAENYVTDDPLARWDARFNRWLNDEAWDPLVRLFEAVTVTGSAPFLFALTGAIVALCLSHGDWPDALLVSSALVGAAALNIVLKLGFERPRPPFHDPELTVSTFSFPSGHASASVGCVRSVRDRPSSLDHSMDSPRRRPQHTRRPPGPHRVQPYLPGRPLLLRRPRGIQRRRCLARVLRPWDNGAARAHKPIPIVRLGARRG
jgi:hypothetical protein